MSVAIRENREKATLWHPVWLTCKVILEPEMVFRCQEYGDKPHRGTPLGRMLGLWPFDVLKRRLMDEAKLFTKYMKLQNFEPLQAESQYEIWGPYMEKLAGYGEWIPEEDNHVVKEKKKAVVATGYRSDEIRFDKGVTMLIRGRFSALYGHEDEQTGILIV